MGLRVMAAAALLVASQPALALVSLTGSGAITASDPVQTGRVLRNGVASTWASQKVFPGLNDGFDRSYDLIDATFAANAMQDVFYRITFNQLNTSLFIVAYDGSFNPANLGTNYLGDPGSSFFQTSFEVTSLAGRSLFLVVNNVSFGSLDHGYSFTVEAFSDANGGENFGAVPEPASWAMLIAGFGLVGALARRRHRVLAA